MIQFRLFQPNAELNSLANQHFTMNVFTNPARYCMICICSTNSTHCVRVVLFSAKYFSKKLIISNSHVICVVAAVTIATVEASHDQRRK